MIQSYEDYQAYLKADREALGVSNSFRRAFFDEIWQFQRLMRTLEYLTNCNKNALYRRLVKFRYERLGRRLGFTMSINLFGPGLAIAHPGTLVVSEHARIGANCRIHVCVNIGVKAGTTDQAPIIGDNCYIGPGVKIYGPITIGSNTAIAANAAVGKSFPEGNCTIGGVPAKIISQQSSAGIVPGKHPTS